jgi:hypothetical protein
MARRSKIKDVFTVGTYVLVPMVGNDWRALILEDRGPIGAGGRRMLLVRAELEATDPIEFEVPADTVRVAA